LLLLSLVYQGLPILELLRLELEPLNKEKLCFTQ
jgi:hypothetical protein